MGEFGKWVLHEDQKELFDYLFANVLNIVFLALISLILWPIGKATMALQLAKGYWVFWIVMILTAGILLLLQRIFCMDLYSRTDAYIISALALSGFLQAGWSAFAALTVRSYVADATILLDVMLYGIGALSCYVACCIVGAFYMGSIYRLVNLPVAIVSFVIFSIWPAAGHGLYGWFFNFF